MYSIRGPFIKQAGACTVAVTGLDRRLDNDSMYIKFAAFGYNIESCEVCGNTNGRQLGWGTICFATEEDADKTIDAALANNINVSEMAGETEPLTAAFASVTRELLPHQNPHQNTVNVIVNVKNFNVETTEDDLRELFEQYGTINSCKIMITTQGEFRRFAIVSFQDSEAANEAVVELNGFEISAGRRLRVKRSQTKMERDIEMKNKLENVKKKYLDSCTALSLFVKNLGPDITSDQLKGIFEKYGRLTNCKVLKNELGVSRQYGFVQFEDSVAANKALLEVNGKVIEEGRYIHVERATKQPNDNQQQQRSRPVNVTRHNAKDIGVSVYVRHLDDTFDETRLRAEFSRFGTILMAKIMREHGISKGYGFVNFETLDQAKRAIHAMHHRFYGSKRLHVDFARPSEYR